MSALVQISLGEKPPAEMPEQLRQEMTGGLLYCHDRANANTSKTLEVMGFAYALIELMIAKGLLTEKELNERKSEVVERLTSRFKEEAMGVMLQKPEIEKYTFQGAPSIDCANRIHLCKAACCRLRVALSQQDLEEGVVRWELAHPYLIAAARMVIAFTWIGSEAAVRFTTSGQFPVADTTAAMTSESGQILRTRLSAPNWRNCSSND